MRNIFADEYGGPSIFSVALIILGAIAVTALIIILIVKSFVMVGEVVSIIEEPLRIYYTQEKDSQYTGTGNDRHFSHYDYIVYKNTDNIDYVVTIRGKNGFGNIKENEIYVTKERANSIGQTDNVGWFGINRKLGDKRSDMNNLKQEISRSHSQQDMSKNN